MQKNTLSRCSIAAALLCVSLAATSRAQAPDPDEIKHYRTNGFVPIHGEQDGTMERAVYAVVGDLVVPRGKTLAFQPGATIMFKKDRRITVEGKLVCDGSRQGTVTFTRLRNNQYYIPIDSSIDSRWDGVFVADSGEVEMRFVYFLDSKYGIEAAKAMGRVELDTVFFRNNKAQNLRIGGRTVALESEKFIKFSAPAPERVAPAWVRPLRIVCGGVALAGAGLAAYGFARHNALALEYDAETNSTRAASLRSSAVTHYALGWVGAGLGILGTVGFVVTFTF